MPMRFASSFRTLPVQLGLFLAFLLCAIWLGIYLQLAKIREQRINEATQGLHNLALAFSEQVHSSVRAIDLSLVVLRDAWLKNPAELQAAVSRQQTYFEHEMAIQIGVIDHDGWLVYSNLETPAKRIFLGDREHFRVHAERQADALYVSKPILGRVSGRWSIQFTRPIFDAQGAFAGVIVLSAAPEYFSRFYQTIDLGSSGVITLLRQGGEILARSPEPEKALGKSLRDAPFLDADAAETGTFQRVAQIDGVERIYAWRRQADLALTVAVGQGAAAILDSYHEQQKAYLSGGGVVSLLLVLAVALMLRGHRQRAAARRQLESSEVRYRTLISALSEGVLLIDRDGIISTANPRALEILGASTSSVIGRSIFGNDWKIVGADSQALEGDDFPIARALNSGEAVSGAVFGLLHGETVGTWIRLNINPLFDKDGAVSAAVVSLDDITSERAAGETLRLSAAVIEHASEGVMVTDHDNRIQMINSAFSEITGYSLAELIGRTPKILASGRHEPEYYATMWHALRESGHWSGEIWNRRKNGDVYPEWLNISVVRNAQGEISYYIALFSDITERKQREERIWRQANFDSLTGLPNRSHFNDRLESTIAEARRTHLPLALLFVDLDHFKWVNDTLGHQAGDRLLREAAERMRGGLREEDTVARLSGDEFAILLPSIAHVEHADRVATKLLETLAKPYTINDREVFVSASIGIAVFPDDGADGTQLLRNADAAMYRAKEAGRNHCAYFTPELHQRAEQRLRLGSELRRALLENQFELHFQPIVTAAGVLVGAEALLRWHHPEDGLRYPDSFIAVAEELGIMPEISAWVLPAAINQLQGWQTRLGYTGYITVNLSSVELRSQAHLRTLLHTLEASELIPGSLILEITETSLLSDDESVIGFLNSARALGVKIALDDFGTGYSSLSYLKRFPFDIIKIDRQFVCGAPEHDGDAALIEAVVALARRLGVKTVAEGVETNAQHAYLAGIDCAQLQGYLIDRPLAAATMEQRIVEAGARAALL